jgi:hypothetical protein
MDNNKDFVILGNMNAIKYKEVLPYIKENKIGLGYHLNGDKDISKRQHGVEQEIRKHLLVHNFADCQT